MSAIPASHLLSAFPNSGAHGNGYPEGGLTIRDYFATAAMQGCLAVRSDNTRFWNKQTLAAYAADFYEMADAMLAAREVHK